MIAHANEVSFVDELVASACRWLYVRRAVVKLASQRLAWAAIASSFTWTLDKKFYVTYNLFY